jgi:hypothetical protein
LACLGAEFDFVVHCSDSLSRVVELHHQHPEKVSRYEAASTQNSYLKISATRFCQAYKDLYDAIWRPSILDDNILPTLSFRTIKQIWEQSKYLKPRKLIFGDISQVEKALGYMLGISQRHKIGSLRLARMANRRLALIPRWTMCGDVVSGSLLPRCYYGRSYFMLHPLPAKKVNFQDLLRKEFCHQGLPIFHCRLSGECWMDTRDMWPESQSLSETQGDVVERDSTHAPISKGSESSTDLTIPSEEQSSPEAQTESAARICTALEPKWRIFAIH